MDAFAELMRHGRSAAAASKKKRTHAPAGGERTTKRARKDEDAGGATTRATAGRCPLCFRMFPANLLEAHASVCEGAGGGGGAPEPGTERPAAGADGGERQWRCVSQLESSSQPAERADAAQVNAFDRLRASSRLQHVSAQSMLMVREPCGAGVRTRVAWRCRGAPAHADEPALWSQRVNVKLQRAAGEERAGAGAPHVLHLSVPLTLSFAAAGGTAAAPFKDYLLRGGRGGEVGNSFNATVLKSAIQKNVRLCRPLAAMRCAWQLVKVASLNELVRRLGVIVIEDAIVHPQFPALAFLTSAIARGFEPDAWLVDLVFRLLYDVAKVRRRDPCDDGEARPARGGGDGGADAPLNLDTLAAALPPEGEGAGGGGPPCPLLREAMLLVQSLLLRASFGGMQGDVAMMNAAARTLKERFDGLRGRPPPLMKGEGFSSALALTSRPTKEAGDAAAAPDARDAGPRWLRFIRGLYEEDAAAEATESAGGTEFLDSVSHTELRRGDVPLSAIDFHCSNVLEEVMADPDVFSRVVSCARRYEAEAGAASCSVDPFDFAKSAMWEMSSSCSNKATIYAMGEEAAAPDARRAALRDAWAVLARPCASFAEEFIKRRLRPRQRLY